MSDEKKFLSWMTYIAGGLVLVYLAMAVEFYGRQDEVLFVPGKEALGPPPSPLIKTVTLTTVDGLALQAWFGKPEKDSKVVVFFHGNADTAASRAWKIPFFRKHGYGIFFCEYRGYGGNPGAPSEQGFYADGRAALGWLKDHGYGPSKLVFDGTSIGAGVAVQMALEQPPAALVLESPFTSLADQVKIRWSMLPVDLLLKNRFDNLEKIGKVKAPLLIVHGDEDLVIPIRFAQSLYNAAAMPKEMLELEGAGHQDLYDHGAGEKITAWLDSQLKPARKH